MTRASIGFRLKPALCYVSEHRPCIVRLPAGWL
jgi:hypothetical protein